MSTPETNREGGKQVKVKWTHDADMWPELSEPITNWKQVRIFYSPDGPNSEVCLAISRGKTKEEAVATAQTIIDALNAHDLKMSHPLICALGEFAIRNQVKHAKDCKSGMHSSHPLQAVSCDCGAFVSALNKSPNETLEKWAEKYSKVGEIGHGKTCSQYHAPFDECICGASELNAILRVRAAQTEVEGAKKKAEWVVQLRARCDEKDGTDWFLRENIAREIDALSPPKENQLNQ